MTNIQHPITESTAIELGREELRANIIKWQNLVQANAEIYDLAFFKIFVKFEGFLVIAFKEYICGNGTASYTPERRLLFEDFNHFEKLVKSNNKGNFIDYLNLIEKFSKEVFVDEKNPFDLLFADATHRPLYDKMRIIRNHIAHESYESQTKYHRFVLSNQNFIEPNTHLQKVCPGTRHTYFTEYINLIENVSAIIVNPIPCQ